MYSQAVPPCACVSVSLNLLLVTLLLFLFKESLLRFSSVSRPDTLAIDLDDLSITNFHGGAISLDKSTVVPVNFLEIKRLNRCLIEIVFFLLRFGCWCRLLFSGLCLIILRLLLLGLGRLVLFRSGSSRFSLILCRLLSSWFSVFLIFFVFLLLLFVLLLVFLFFHSLFVGASNYGVDAEVEAELSGGGGHVARVPRAVRVCRHLFGGCA